VADARWRPAPPTPSTSGLARPALRSRLEIRFSDAGGELRGPLTRQDARRVTRLECGRSIRGSGVSRRAMLRSPFEIGRIWFPPFVEPLFCGLIKIAEWLAAQDDVVEVFGQSCCSAGYLESYGVIVPVGRIDGAYGTSLFRRLHHLWYAGSRVIQRHRAWVIYGGDQRRPLCSA